MSTSTATPLGIFALRTFVRQLNATGRLPITELKVGTWISNAKRAELEALLVQHGIPIPMNEGGEEERPLSLKRPPEVNPPKEQDAKPAPAAQAEDPGEAEERMEEPPAEEPAEAKETPGQDHTPKGTFPCSFTFPGEPNTFQVDKDRIGSEIMSNGKTANRRQVPDHFDPALFHAFAEEVLRQAPDNEALRGELWAKMERFPWPQDGGSDSGEGEATPEPQDAPEPQPDPREALLQSLADALKPKLDIQVPMDLEKIRAIAREEAAETVAIHEKLVKHGGGGASKVVLKVNGAPEVELQGLTHKQLPTLLKWVHAHVPVMLVGPAGSGKTKAAEQVAEALGLMFFAQSVCSQTTKSDLLGYMDAHSHCVWTPFRHAYEEGGLFLLDEMDAGNSNVLMVINAAIGNGFCAFADGMVKKHPDFRCISAGNTWGTGRTVEYVGRNPIDAATLDRFITIHWEVDEDLERSLCPYEGWVNLVQAFRAVIQDKGIKHLVTPRATLYGAAALAVDLPAKQVVTSVLAKGLDERTLDAVMKDPRIVALKGKSLTT